MAKVLFFRETDRMVYKQPWYSGYKANIVTYSLAKFDSMVKAENLFIDFLYIWNKQAVPQPYVEQLQKIAETVNDLIMNSPFGETSNPSEWAKKTACWERIKEKDIPLIEKVKPFLVNVDEQKHRKKAAASQQKVDDSLEPQISVVKKGGAYWRSLQLWISNSNYPTVTKERGILGRACRMDQGSAPPSEAQSRVLLQLLSRALGDGFVEPSP